MGYDTKYYGRLEIGPTPLPRSLREEIQRNSDNEHREGNGPDGKPIYPGIHCDFTVTNDGTSIVWNGSEKTYNGVEWINWIIFQYLFPNGYTLTGHLDAQGADSDDVWRLMIRRSGGRDIAYRQEATLVWEPVVAETPTVTVDQAVAALEQALKSVR
jgi:hypothetical protein